MLVSRRQILKWMSSAAIVAGGSYWLLRDKFEGQTPTNNAIEALIDTLVPADESPGALELNTVEYINNKAQSNRRFKVVVARGSKWLDQQATKQFQRVFHQLSEEQRQQIVMRAEASPVGTLPNLFFTQMREEVFFHYYADPRSWQSLNYPGPPQPRGFLDFVAPPSGRS